MVAADSLSKILQRVYSPSLEAGAGSVSSSVPAERLHAGLAPRIPERPPPLNLEEQPK